MGSSHLLALHKRVETAAIRRLGYGKGVWTRPNLLTAHPTMQWSHRLGVDFARFSISLKEGVENHLEGIWGTWNGSPSSHLRRGQRCCLLYLLFPDALHLLD